MVTSRLLAHSLNTPDLMQGKGLQKLWINIKTCDHWNYWYFLSKFYISTYLDNVLAEPTSQSSSSFRQYGLLVVQSSSDVSSSPSDWLWPFSDTSTNIYPRYAYDYYFLNNPLSYSHIHVPQSYSNYSPYPCLLSSYTLRILTCPHTAIAGKATQFRSLDLSLSLSLSCIPSWKTSPLPCHISHLDTILSSHWNWKIKDHLIISASAKCSQLHFTAYYTWSNRAVPSQGQRSKIIKVQLERSKITFPNFQSMQYIGPILMGIGTFVLIIACVITLESRDKHAQVWKTL